MKAKLKVVITAGPTREHLDPVRFLSNPSTGKMGFALARAAAAHGHEVVLIAGPVGLKTPAHVTRVNVTSAREMLSAVETVLGPRASRDARHTVFIATAAVADWRPATCAKTKLKKGAMTDVLRLKRNPDIVASVKGVRKVGFAAETGDPRSEAARKCRAKNLEFIVANDVTKPDAGFGVDTNRVVILRPDGASESWPVQTKLSIAKKIITLIEKKTDR